MFAATSFSKRGVFPGVKVYHSHANCQASGERMQVFVFSFEFPILIYTCFLFPWSILWKLLFHCKCICSKSYCCSFCILGITSKLGHWTTTRLHLVTPPVCSIVCSATEARIMSSLVILGWQFGDIRVASLLFLDKIILLASLAHDLFPFFFFLCLVSPSTFWKCNTKSLYYPFNIQAV